MAKSLLVRAGNGSPCISHPDHGPSIVLSSGREWCPSSEHSGKPKPRPNKADKPGSVGATTPYLDKQKAPEAKAS